MTAFHPIVKAQIIAVTTAKQVIWDDNMYRFPTVLCVVAR